MEGNLRKIIWILYLDESVLIVFIDYGNSESKSPKEIYPLIESLARLPAMTVACTLNEVKLSYWIVPFVLLFVLGISK
jgi:hypothetical protein